MDAIETARAEYIKFTKTEFTYTEANLRKVIRVYLAHHATNPEAAQIRTLRDIYNAKVFPEVSTYVFMMVVSQLVEDTAWVLRGTYPINPSGFADAVRAFAAEYEAEKATTQTPIR